MASVTVPLIIRAPVDSSFALIGGDVIVVIIAIPAESVIKCNLADNLFFILFLGSLFFCFGVKLERYVDPSS